MSGWVIKSWCLILLLFIGENTLGSYVRIVELSHAGMGGIAAEVTGAATASTHSHVSAKASSAHAAAKPAALARASSIASHHGNCSSMGVDDVSDAQVDLDAGDDGSCQCKSSSCDCALVLATALTASPGVGVTVIHAAEPPQPYFYADILSQDGLPPFRPPIA